MVLGTKYGVLASTFPSTIAIASKAISLVLASAQSLSMPIANFGAIDRQKFGLSIWIKPTDLNTVQSIASQWQNNSLANQAFSVLYDTNGQLHVDITSGVTSYQLYSQSSVIASGTYTHVYVRMDTTDATANDRIRMWVNGTELTSFSTRNNPPQNTQMNVSTVAVFLGSLSTAGSATVPMNGLIYQPGFFTAGTLPVIGSLYSGGKVNINGVAGLTSLEDPSTTITHDNVLATAWTNNNTVTSTTTIPS